MKKLITMSVLAAMLCCQTISVASNEPDGQALPSEEQTVPFVEQALPSEKPSLFTIPEEGMPVLMYHSISTKYDLSICVSPEEFEQQMKWLYENGYSTVNIEDFSRALAGEAILPEKPIMISFDDGYNDNYNVAWPIMEKYGFRATFFIVTAGVDPFNMDWNQLRDLHEKGNSIGSHTSNHKNLSKLDCGSQEMQLRQSKCDLENNLGIDITAFCFPYGMYNNTTLSLLPQLGYTMSFTINEGRVHSGDNAYELKRIHVRGGMPFEQFVEKVSYS